LAPPYDEALRQAVIFILERVPDILGIVVSGTIIRGTPSPTSDLDIYAIRRKAERQRTQRWFNGVPAEIFVNPPDRVRGYIAREHQEARPITAHMLATGHCVLAEDPVVEELRTLAREMLSTPPDVPAQRRIGLRYGAATRFEDATDSASVDPEAARMIMGHAVRDMVHVWFLEAGQFIPRDKDLLTALQAQAPELGTLVRQFYRSPSLDEALALAHEIADRTIRTYGFFEWESGPEPTDEA
jgi:hypothetical protein